MSTAPPQLDYGKPPPLHHRRGFQRAAIVGAIAILLVVAWQQGPTWWREIRAAYYERQCKAYTTPVSQIIFSYDVSAGRTDTSSAPDCWIKFCATSYFAGFSLRGPRVPLVFLHERVTPSGDKQLVAVVLTGYSRRNLQFDAGLSAADRCSIYTTPVDIEHLDTGLLRLYAGQPDPADPSHFTIGYDMNGKPGTIDGWLENDRSVEIQVRDGPLKPSTTDLPKAQ